MPGRLLRRGTAGHKRHKLFSPKAGSVVLSPSAFPSPFFFTFPIPLGHSCSRLEESPEDPGAEKKGIKKQVPVPPLPPRGRPPLIFRRRSGSDGAGLRGPLSPARRHLRSAVTRVHRLLNVRIGLRRSFSSPLFRRAQGPYVGGFVPNVRPAGAATVWRPLPYWDL